VETSIWLVHGSMLILSDLIKLVTKLFSWLVNLPISWMSSATLWKVSAISSMLIGFLAGSRCAGGVVSYSTKMASAAGLWVICVTIRLVRRWGLAVGVSLDLRTACCEIRLEESIGNSFTCLNSRSKKNCLFNGVGLVESPQPASNVNQTLNQKRLFLQRL